MLVPQWTERMFRVRSGRDHLGLASVAQDRLLPHLSPDIIVATVHPRYWSFYAFLLDEFWRRELHRSRAAYQEFYRPREAIFVAAVLSCDRAEHHKYGPFLGVVGSEKVSALVAEQPAAFDPGFDYIGATLGGYGAIYAGVLYSMGLVQPAGPGVPYDAPTPEGRVVAEGFREAIADTRYFREFFDNPAKKVPREVVAEYGRFACLCQLQKPSALDRTLLRDVFLHAGSDDDATRRRQTMRVLLDIADQAPVHPISEDCFRQLIHYRECWHESDEEIDNATWSPRSDLSAVARGWRAFQVHEYYAFALNRLWSHLSDWGVEETESGSRSISLDDLWGFVESALDFSALADEFGFKDPGFDAASTVDAVIGWAASLADVSHDLDAPWARSAEIDEHDLYLWGRDPGTEPETVPAMLLMLLLAFARVGVPAIEANYPQEWHLLGIGGIHRLAMTRFLTRMRRARMSRSSLLSVARWIYEDYVINQHQRVAVAKLPDDTYRFRREGDRLWFQDHDNRVVMPNSRYGALSGAVYELGFVGNMRHPGHTLSPHGRKLLEQGDLTPRPVTGGAQA